MQQVQHTIGMRASGSLLPFIIPIGEALVAIGIFSAIRFHQDLHPLVLLTAISVSLNAALTLKIALKLAQTTIDNSKTYRDLYKSCPGGRQNKIDKLRFASCRPLVWVIGNSFRIQKDTFPKIMQDVIVDTIVNLLVYSRSAP